MGGRTSDAAEMDGSVLLFLLSEPHPLRRLPAKPNRHSRMVGSGQMGEIRKRAVMD